MQFFDLAAQQARIKDRIDERIQTVLAHGSYILGPEVAEFETALAAFCGAKHAIGCANGTDALQLALMALGIEAGDAVFCPSFTFAATAEVVPWVGATPVLVDVDPATFNMDAESLKRAIAHARQIGLNPAMVMPVDLFGLPADYPTLTAIARAEGMKMICDSAQGFGGLVGNTMTGRFGDVTTTSFFPAKPLGCYGDGGAILTEDDDLAELMSSLRFHGKGSYKYDNVRIGMNSRLDTLQAAILLEKIAIYDDEIAARQRVAERYTMALKERFVTPHVPAGMRSIWAQYTLRASSEAERDAALEHLRSQEIPTAVYYPRPLHQQTAYAGFPADPAGLPESEAAARTVFSLPMHPYLDEHAQARIIEACLSVPAVKDAEPS
ncbi:DegT/DnrJ/EryC1/StrS family aminotransferase [Oceaniradius stylonematis]|uniref:DegT/DnrJ/EryC1/StrS family aminotransferase n=1 Tax=Oceaniradius stylonematis TaxID=2184161 RepID=UPI00273D0D6D|nr:DegT/DnrJ/EryC1/StrS aminotransferase family protein [Oceaniradius stylonematis]